ncbi:TonB-dependent receptor [Roseivirga pacifica]
MKLRTLLLAFLAGVSFWCHAQSESDYLISGTYDTPVAQFIQESQSNFNIKVYHKPQWFKQARVVGDYSNEPLLNVLNAALAPIDLKVFQYSKTLFVVIPQAAFRPEDAARSEGPIPLDQVITVGSDAAVQGDMATIKGYVADGQTGDSVAGAVVYAISSAKGTTTNEDGYYEMEVPIGQQQFRFSFLGYQNGVAMLDIKSSGTFNMDLYDQVTELNSVTVTAEGPDENVQSVVMGVEKMDIQMVKRMPVLMGEADVVRSLTLLPGVTTVGEGAAGFNVRGGSVGENLILQDGSELFNSSHLFGFFSVFNPDLVEDLTLYKGGGIQADMGGRLSSVLNVNLKEGDKEEFHGRGGIGSLMGRLSLEGPIIKEKSSFSVGGRISYSDWLLKQYNDIDLKKSKAGFNDLNLKISNEISPKDNLNLSGYLSKDYFKLANDTVYTYGTKLGSIGWDHSFSDKFFSYTNASIGQYYSDVEDEEGVNQFEMNAKINYLSASQEFVSNHFDMHELKFGGKVTKYEINQGELRPLPGALNTEEITIPEQNGYEFGFYLADSWTVNEKLSVNAGLRYSMFNNVGPEDVYVYQDGVPMSTGSIIDTLSYGSEESIQKYGGFEPRFSLRYALDETSSIKVGYNRLRQYMHLVSNTAAITPVDVWQMSNSYIRPAVSDQYTIGYFRNFNDNSIEASIELYYKSSDDILDYKGGANLLLNETLETDLLQGEGRAKGIELSLKKTQGRTTGWISYTYSRTELRAISEFPLESVNNGNWYPANYDKPHNLSVVFTQQLTKRITFNANFVYSTGRPITAPTSVYQIGPYRQFPNYSERNQFRIPDYHRLDVSLTIDRGFAKFKKIKSEWNFSIYNVYGRKNAYSIYFSDTSRAYKLAILGFVPSVSYNFIF